MGKNTKRRFQQLDIFDFLKEKKAVSDKERLLSAATEKLSRGVPFDDPSGISYDDKYFCLTGRFGFGSQAECSKVISQAGGRVQEKVSAKTEYLIVGEKLNSNWKLKYYGLKIQKALLRKLAGADIRLIQEADLSDILPRNRTNPDSRQMTIEDFLDGEEN